MSLKCKKKESRSSFATDRARGAALKSSAGEANWECLGLEKSFTSQLVLAMPFLFGKVLGRRRVMHDDFGEQFRLKPLEVTRPLFVVVNAHRQADGARVVLGEIGEALARIDNIAVLADGILSGFGTAVIGNGIGRAIDAAGPAGVAESGSLTPEKTASRRGFCFTVNARLINRACRAGI